MNRYCFRLLRASLSRAQGNQSDTRLSCPTPIPLSLLARPSPLSTQIPRSVAPKPIYRRGSFWATLLAGLTLVGALLFFLIQWLYQDWTARKDFLAYCQSLQDAHKSLTASCEQALVVPLSPPPFSRGGSVRRYIANKTPLPVLVVYGESSALRCFLFIELFLSSMLIIGTITIMLVYYSTSRVYVADLDKEMPELLMDEENKAESDLARPRKRSQYTTAVEGLNRSGLRQRNHNVDSIDLAVFVAQLRGMRLSGSNTVKKPRGKELIDRNEDSANIPGPKSFAQMPSGSSRGLKVTFHDDLGVELPKWPVPLSINNTITQLQHRVLRLLAARPPPNLPLDSMHSNEERLLHRHIANTDRVKLYSELREIYAQRRLIDMEFEKLVVPQTR